MLCAECMNAEEYGTEEVEEIANLKRNGSNNSLYIYITHYYLHEIKRPRGLN